MAVVKMEDLLPLLKGKAPRDPHFWGEILCLNWDFDEFLIPAINWILDQPECDASFAYDTLELIGSDVQYGWAAGCKDFLPYGADFQSPEVLDKIAVVEKISKRSEDGSFAPAAYKVLNHDGPGYLRMLEGHALELKKRGLSIPLPFPTKLLSKPLDPNLPKRSTPAQAWDDVLHVPDEWV